VGFDVRVPEIRSREDIDKAFEALKDRADAIYVVADPLVSTNRLNINTLRSEPKCRRCTPYEI